MAIFFGFIQKVQKQLTDDLSFFSQIVQEKAAICTKEPLDYTQLTKIQNQLLEKLLKTQKDIPRLVRFFEKQHQLRIRSHSQYEQSSLYDLHVHLVKVYVILKQAIQKYVRILYEQEYVLENTNTKAFFQLRKKELALLEQIQQELDEHKKTFENAEKFIPQKKSVIRILLQSTLGNTFSRVSALLLVGIALVTSDIHAQQTYYTQQIAHESIVQKAQQPFIATVTIDNLRVRSQPSISDSDILTTISRRDVTVTGYVQKKDILWYQIVIEKHGTRCFGYIAARNGSQEYVQPKSQTQFVSHTAQVTIAEFANFIAQWEGFKPYAYRDPSSRIHAYAIGYGTLLDAKTTLAQNLAQLGLQREDLLQKRVGITREQARFLLEQEVQFALETVKSQIHTFNELPRDIQLVLVDMAYTMSRESFGTFVRMIAAANRHDYVHIQKEMIDSRWFKDVGRNRSQNHVALLQRIIQRYVA